MNEVTVITPPDVLYNDVLSILVIHPRDELKTTLNNVLMNSLESVNLFFYDLKADHDIEWLLLQVKRCNVVILDLDNTEPFAYEFASYIIAQPNSFYLTSDNITPYNLISKNRIYDLSWLETVLNRGNNE
jgi:hypothetical protein